MEDVHVSPCPQFMNDDSAQLFFSIITVDSNSIRGITAISSQDLYPTPTSTRLLISMS
ncbi:hypothetical protein B7P43_G17962 [Cryptotermes secundus]|uniref:Uncharacterized protein n=1 Tax=Cryptotermes secundus TaxID=105785 RepID=A0A2J7QUG1_9NEOP|nr:hypothetical protein B7P43_G17962 [Cryptotermes secundus]